MKLKLTNDEIRAHLVSIKPDAYRAKRGLNEAIDLLMICYSKKKDGIVIEFD